MRGQLVQRAPKQYGFSGQHLQRTFQLRLGKVGGQGNEIKGRDVERVDLEQELAGQRFVHLPCDLDERPRPIWTVAETARLCHGLVQHLAFQRLGELLAERSQRPRTLWGPLVVGAKRVQRFQGDRVPRLPLQVYQHSGQQRPAIVALLHRAGSVQQIGDRLS